MTTRNIVMWVARLSVVNWVYSKTRTLLVTLRTRNQPREESYVSSEVEQLSPSVGCARSTHQYPTVLHNLNLIPGCRFTHGRTTCSRPRCVVIEVLRSTNATATQNKLAQGNLCTRGDHSINKIKTKTPTEKREREVEQLSNMDYVPTNTH